MEKEDVVHGEGWSWGPGFEAMYIVYTFRGTINTKLGYKAFYVEKIVGGGRTGKGEQWMKNWTNGPP